MAFAIDWPSGASVSRYTRISLGSPEAAARPVFHVGPTVSGAPIYSIEIVSSEEPAVDRAYVLYAARRDAWQLPKADEIRYVMSERLPSEESLSAVRRRLILGVVQVAPDGSATVEVVRDDMLITIGARNEQELEKMVANLQAAIATPGGN